jgi:hypothetical protein
LEVVEVVDNNNHHPSWKRKLLENQLLTQINLKVEVAVEEALLQMNQ